MPDLSKMSDDELMRIAKGGAESPAAKMSDDELMKIAAEPPKESISPARSALAGVNNGLTFGFFDEAIGALRAAKEKISGSKEPFVKLYEKNRDDLRAWENRARDANPKSFFAGDVAGNVATMALPGVRALQPVAKASAGVNIAKAAGLGGLVAAGETEKPLLSEGFMEDVAKGAAVGGAAQGALGAVGKGIDKLRGLKDVAAERAVKSGTGQQLKALRELEGTKKLQTVGQDLMKADEAGSAVVGWFSRAEDIAPAAKAKAKFFGEKIGEVARQMDDLIPNAVSGEEIAKRIRAYKRSLVPEAVGEGLLNRLDDIADKMAARGDMGFSKAQDLKNAFKYKFKSNDAVLGNQDVTNAVKKAIGESMDTAASRAQNEIGDSLSAARDLIGKYDLFKQKYGSFASMAKYAGNRKTGNLSNRFISPSDYFMGGTGGLATMAVTGEPISGVALAAAGALVNKIARERGSAFAARSMNSLANVLEKSPDVLKDYGPQIMKAAQEGIGALILTHMALLADKDYRDTIERYDDLPRGIQLPVKTSGQGLRLPVKPTH